MVLNLGTYPEFLWSPSEKNLVRIFEDAGEFLGHQLPLSHVPDASQRNADDHTVIRLKRVPHLSVIWKEEKYCYLTQWIKNIQQLRCEQKERLAEGLSTISLLNMILLNQYCCGSLFLESLKVRCLLSTVSVCLDTSQSSSLVCHN